MKPAYKILLAVLLLFNGSGALFGGYNLVVQPDGGSLGLPINLLKHSPFADYFIPGIILFIANGLFSLVALAALIFKSKKRWLLITLQGIILTGWIASQLLLIRTFSYYHIILGTIGVALMVAGIELKKTDKQQ